MYYPAERAARRRPRWPPWLTLLLLAPFLGEVVGGPTPLVGASPVAVVFDLCLYGTGAILVRELARRRGLSWTGIWLLGAAYGVIEEGLVITSWFNPIWPDSRFLGGYSWFAGTDWAWAVLLTAYHATISITVPIVLAEAFHPGEAGRPWLDLQGTIVAAVIFAAAAAGGLVVAGFVLFASLGYTHPPPAYLFAVLAVALLVPAALGRRRGETPAGEARPLSRWWLRALGAGAATLHLWLGYRAPGLQVPPVITIGAELGLVAGVGWYLARQGARAGWGPASALALVQGLVFPFLVRDIVPNAAGDLKPLGVLAGIAVLVLSARSLRRALRDREVPPIDAGEPQPDDAPG